MSLIDVDEDPALHRSSFSRGKNGEPVLDWQRTCESVEPGITATIERARREGIDLLIEGVHIVPSDRLLRAWREGGGIAQGGTVVTGGAAVEGDGAFMQPTVVTDVDASGHPKDEFDRAQKQSSTRRLSDQNNRLEPKLPPSSQWYLG